MTKKSMNPVVKVSIASDIFLWSAWNFVMPIFGIFITSEIVGGNIEIAASAYSVFLLSRVVFELLGGKLTNGTNDYQKILIAIFGIVITAFSYVGFAFTTNIIMIYVFYIISGVGLGISSPAKYALFSTHLDKGKEAGEWGVYDAGVYIGMAVTASIGGFIVRHFGFQTLFLLAAFFTLLSLIPYLLYLQNVRESRLPFFHQ